MRFKTFISEQTRKPEHTHAVTRGGNVVSYHTSSKSAHKKADSLDNKYGSTVHSVKLLESEISEMIPYALSAANANAEHARQRKAKEEEEKRKAKEQLDKDSEDTGNPFANWKPVKESHVKVGQHVKFNEPVAGTTRHSRKPMSFDGGKVIQVTPTHAIVRPQAWHGDEGLDVHVPHKNIKEEVKTFKVGDKVSIHAPDDLDWHERKGELISTSDDGHVVKLNDGTRLSAANHQIKKIDEEVELDEGLVSAIKRAFTPKPKTPDEAIADFRKKTKDRTQQNLGPAAKRKPKQYTTRLPDSGRKPESRSEYTANREMTKENYAIAAKTSQSFKTFRGGVKGKGTGSRRTQTNQVADHVKIYKESTND